jgi:hypothetical protein
VKKKIIAGLISALFFKLIIIEIGIIKDARLIFVFSTLLAICAIASFLYFIGYFKE